MADNIPVASSGPREPVKRPRPIPKPVRAAIAMMVCGGDAIDGAPMDLVAAAKSVGMRPDTLRRYLGRPQVIAFLRAERKAFREAVCAGNEAALQRVRDGDKHNNAMARVAAVRALEGLSESDTSSGPGRMQQGPGIVIILNPGGLASPTPQPMHTIEHDAPIPAPPDPDKLVRQRVPEPRFVPPRRW
jgi:hypothetical protein